MNAALETISFFWPAFAGCIVVAVACALLGVHLVGRRQVVIGVALPQLAAAGIALSFLLDGLGGGTADALSTGHAEATWLHDAWAVAFAVVGLVLLQWRGPRRRLPPEVTAAAAFVLGGSLAVVLVQGSAFGMDELRHLVDGEILAIHERSLPALLAVEGAIVLLLVLFHRSLVYVTFDRESAAVAGVRTRRLDLLFHALLAVGVARSVHATGTLFVFAFLVLPATAGLALGRRVVTVFAIAAMSAALAAALGFVVAADERVDWPVGPTAGLVVVLLAGLAALAGRWRRPATADSA